MATATAAAALAGLVPCDPRAGDAACATRFIEGFGKRAYRRPLTPDEVGRLQAVHTSAGDFATGIRLVIAGLLQSPTNTGSSDSARYAAVHPPSTRISDPVTNDEALDARNRHAV